MDEDIIIGVDLAKNVFQLHGASRDGQVVFRKKLSRAQFAKFCVEHPPALIAMEACATAHYWARELEKYGHDVGSVPGSGVGGRARSHWLSAARGRAGGHRVSS
jgi:transposase